MRLTVITSSTWIVAAPVEERGRCFVREALDAVAVTDQAAHAQLLAAAADDILVERGA